MKTSDERAAWLIERQKGIGGSDAAAVAGLSPWKTPYEVYLDKVTPILGDEIEREEFLWGHLIEPVIRQRFTDLHDVRVLLPSDPVIHPQQSFMRCNPDGLIFNDEFKVDVDNGSLNVAKAINNRQFAATLQIKNWGFGKEQWGESGSEDIPEHYMIQVQHEIECCQVDKANVAVLFHGNDYREYPIARNQEMIDVLIDVERDFWNSVLRREPPEPETEADVRRRWQHVFVHDLIELDGDDPLLDVHEQLREARAQIKRWEKEKQSLEITLKKAIADTEGLSRNGKPLCTWKEQSQQRFDTDRFKAEQPELHAQYLKEISFRKFLMKKA
jgi:putative phage-type endonuclease